MPITDNKIGTLTDKIVDLPDKPNSTMSAADLKAYWDSQPEQIRAKHDALINFLVSAQGAGGIGAAVTGIAGDDVQEIMSNLLSEINRAKPPYSPVVDVKAYGAKGDGVTDDAPAIRSAIAAAAAAGGGIIYYPPGTYLLKTLTTGYDGGRDIFFEIKSNIAHVGTGYGSHLKVDDGLSATHDWHVFYTKNDVENIGFYNLRIDNNSQNNPIPSSTVRATWQIAAYACAITNLTVDSVWFENNSGRNCVYTLPNANKSGTCGASSNATTCYADFSDKSYVGYWIYNVTDGSSAKIVQSFADRVVVQVLEGGTSNTFATGNTFSVIKQSENVHIRNCHFYNMKNDVNNTDHSSVWLLCDYGSLRNCTFKNDPNHPYLTSGHFIGAFEVHGSNIIVSNNKVDYYEKAGYVVAAQHDADNVMISDNVFTHLRNYGIEIWSLLPTTDDPGTMENVKICNNLFTFMTGDDTNLPVGIATGSSVHWEMENLEISNNTFKPSTGYINIGIAVTGDTATTYGAYKNLVIRDNEMVNVKTGIQISGSRTLTNIIVEENKINGNTSTPKNGHGIDIQTILKQYTNIQILRNKIRGMGYSGIHVALAPTDVGLNGLIIKDNTIMDCGLTGTDNFTQSGITVYSRNSKAVMPYVFIEGNEIFSTLATRLLHALHYNGFADTLYMIRNTFTNISGASVLFEVEDFNKRYMQTGTGTVWDPTSIAAGASLTRTVTVTTANIGDLVKVSPPYSLQGLGVSAYVSAANTVTIVLNNNTGGAVDLPSGTWKVYIEEAN